MNPIYSLLFLLLTFSACAHEQINQAASLPALRFDVEGVDETRGVITTTQNIRSMSVFCAHTGTQKYSSSATCNWMHNAAVTRADNNSEWVVGGAVNNQWKDEGYHSFFAFAPHAPEGVVVSESSGTAPPTLTYTVPADYTKQVDLLYSHTTLINGKQMYIGSRPVCFGFEHALSKITFDAKKEDIVTDEVVITDVKLTSIINKAQYQFKMNSDYTNVEGINSIAESTKISDFSITPNQKINSTESLLLPADQALFMINQSFTDKNQLIVTYTKGKEKGRTITVNLSAVTPGGWDMSKAYRYSILVKEDRVTVTTAITDWADQAVDVATSGAYLNTSQLKYSFTMAKVGTIYYTTDEGTVTGTCDKNITLTHDSNAKKFSFPSSAPTGDYIVTIKAGKLTRKVQIAVVEPDVSEFIPETGVAAPRIFVQGTEDNAKLMLTQSPTNYGVYFQFGGLIAWGYVNNADRGTPLFNIYNSAYTNWTSDAAHTIANIKIGKGDPCRLVGYTVAEIKSMITSNQLPDNRMWKTPSWTDSRSFFITEKERTGWMVVSGVNGHFFPKSTSTDNFLPAAGLADSNGWMQARGIMGRY